jgi:hypothetical protein
VWQVLQEKSRYRQCGALRSNCELLAAALRQDRVAGITIAGLNLVLPSPPCAAVGSETAGGIFVIEIVR